MSRHPTPQTKEAPVDHIGESKCSEFSIYSTSAVRERTGVTINVGTLFAFAMSATPKAVVVNLARDRSAWT